MLYTVKLSGDRFCVNKKGGRGRGLTSTNSMAVSELGCRKVLVGTG